MDERSQRGDDSHLSATSLDERHAAALAVMDHELGNGDLILSYVVWPDRVPSQTIIRFAIERRRRRDVRRIAA